jgi:hypothetical protein
LKWDAFVGRKGGMNNILPPITQSTNTAVKASPPRSLQTELSRPSKTDVTPQTTRQETSKIGDRPSSPTPDQHRHVDSDDNKKKDLLKGKPIIFVGGGPGKIKMKFYKK